MWKKLYSNSGLILLAVLAAGAWFSNILSYFPSKNTPKIDAVATPSHPQGQTSEDRLRIWRQEQAASTTPTPSAIGIFEPRKIAPSATAICADGTYSYSASRRVTCSHHGGVAQWLSR